MRLNLGPHRFTCYYNYTPDSDLLVAAAVAAVAAVVVRAAATAAPMMPG